MAGISDSDKQFNAKLIDDYQRLSYLRGIAVKENALETVAAIDREISFIKLKLHPIELPDEK